MISNALIGWNIFSSLNAVILTSERNHKDLFITGHMVYNPAYNQILQLKATLIRDSSLKTSCLFSLLDVKPRCSLSNEFGPLAYFLQFMHFWLETSYIY